MRNTDSANGIYEIRPFLTGAQPAKMSLQGGVLCIGEYENFHISHVEVFTGNDDGVMTDQMIVERDPLSTHESPKLLASKQILLDRRRKTPGRLRSEPGVRIALEAENSEAVHHVLVYHHKGCIYVEVVAETDTLPEEDRMSLEKTAAQLKMFDPQEFLK